jgi:high-affinity iron transporter
MKLIAALPLILLASSVLADQDTQNLIQMLDYVGVDYPEAVADGQIIDAMEYQEMLDFAAGINGLAARLPASSVKPGLRAQAQALTYKINARAVAREIAAVTGSMRATVIRRYNVSAIPPQPPNLSFARGFFTENCAECHGAEGRGDGPQSTGMEPAPTNFHDAARYRQRTLYGLYNTITLGVEGTAMPAYPGLSEHARWSLAYYVGQLAVNPALLDQGAAMWKRSDTAGPLTDLETLTTITPLQAQAQYGKDGAAVMAYLRAHPARSFHQRTEPLTYTRQQLARSFALYENGSTEAAYQAAVTAYLEGFELIETSLDTADRNLRVSIEEAMSRYRNSIRNGVPQAAARAQLKHLYALLDETQEQLDAAALSGMAAFAASLVILLREGLEALLIVAALTAFLIKTDKRYGLPYVHAGWIGALALGLLTWVASAYAIKISGATREVTEGIAAILAAGVLFYVGFWLHDKTHARQWQQFIEVKVQSALGQGTLWGLAGLSFIAVYREAFETILFYQALWAQTDATGHSLALAGMGVAAVALVAIAWLLLRYSVRLPLKQFFAISGVFLFGLAVILAGQGVAALQEAGKVPISPITFPRIEILGIYPNWESLLVQLCMVLLALGLIWSSSVRRAAHA